MGIELFDFYICTVVGGTRYLEEWLQAVKKLNPSKIIIAKDVSRSEPIKKSIDAEIIEYDSGIPWEGYEKRHIGYKSDKSILDGIKILIKNFIMSEQTHFIHVDSDIILSDEAIRQITSKDWDYLQFGIPVVPRDKQNLPDWRTHVMIFWDSTVFGLSKRLAKLVAPMLKLIVDPYPVDINIHRVIKQNFIYIHDRKHLVVNNAKITHYINGERIVA